MFAPRFEITPSIAKALITIEADRQAIELLPIDVEMVASLRETARLRATHYSTQIEGNRLTEIQVQQALDGARFPGRERDELEVRNYYRALEEVERLAQSRSPITEAEIQRIHGWVLEGRAAPTPYRDGQNVIRDSHSGEIVYLPPEASDVSRLMGELVDWIGANLTSEELPIPILAALAHYQFATIHPYYDGNGRTARLMTTLLLHRAGYGLKGIYNLEEYYARHLEGYYQALTIGPSHNYYLGRAEAPVTGFIAYFCTGMAEALGAVCARADRATLRGGVDQSKQLRLLDVRQRRVLVLFHRQAIATPQEIADQLGLGKRTVLTLCQSWVESGFLVVHDPSRKARAYRLGEFYEALVTASL